MARLPQPGSDNGTWGDILNDYLSQVHKPDGTIKDNAVTSDAIADNAVSAATIQDGSITEAQFSAAVQTKLNSIAGSPAWGDITNKPAVIAAGADQAAARTAIGAGTSSLAIGTTNTTAKAGDYTPTKAEVGLSNVDNTSDSGKPVSVATQTALDAKLAVPTGVPDGTKFLRDDNSWQAVPAVVSGSGSLSGFPLRKSGETVVASPQELANAFASSTSPTGAKTIVLAESWDKPGILKHIWIACNNTSSSSGFLEQGGVIRIYTDDATSPAVSMSLGDFFILSNHSDVYSTPRVGRTSRGGGDQSSAYRYLHMPFQKYLRVEVENTTNADTVFYGQADYSLIDSFADLGDQQLAYSIKGQRASNQPVRQPITICDFAGSGQVESFWLSFSGADSGDSGVLEGNIEIYIDGEAFPSWWASGTEDAFNGGWYTMPVGGYPAGRAGNSDQPGQNSTLYRFFVDDPVFFSSHLKVVMWPGQPHQASIVSSTVDYAGYVGVWTNNTVTPNYVAVDPDAAPVADDQMNQSAGAIDSASWNQSGDRTQATATGSSFVTAYGNANADEDVRIARKSVSLPSDYWVETRLRITDTTHDEQQAHLLMLGSSPDPYFGSAIHLQLYRHDAGNWTLNVRDDFATAFVVNIGSGRNLANHWVRLALKKVGTRVTAYYSMNPAPATWIPIGSWIASKSGTAYGVGTWTAAAEFDYLVVRPLKSVTS